MKKNDDFMALHSLWKFAGEFSCVCRVTTRMCEF